MVTVSEKQEQVTEEKESRHSTSFILNMVMPYKGWLILVFAAMALETLMSLAAPWPLKIIIDNVIHHDPLPSSLAWLNTVAFIHNDLGLAAVAAIAVVLFAAIGALAGYINSYFTESIAQFVANDLRQRIYHHLQRLSLTYYNTHQVAKIISTITTDVTTIQEFASQSLLRILVDLLTITGMLCIVFFLHWDFALVAVGITPFLLLFVARFKREVKKATREVRKDQSAMAAIMQQGLESMRAVNAYGTQHLEEQRLKVISMETVSAALKARRLKAMLVPVISITVSICIAIVLWRGATLVLSNAMTVGALTVFLAYLSKFFTPVQDLAKMSNIVAQSSVALERIREILDTDTIIPEKPNAVSPGKLKGNIVFEKVQFSYLEDAPTLIDFSFTVQTGQKIGICGPTGSGKSTVASLIPRFYDPQSGRILIDGVDVRDYKIEELRAQIGFVLQDTLLFYGTIRDNISYGCVNATDEEIIAAARLANAEGFILRMPEGYQSMVGERGYTLSGGQRQCIGIARAILRNAPMLILDEPTASLDTESEKIVMDALEKLMQGRTVITIAHRLSTIRDADRIVVMKNGSIIEEGTHTELITIGGLYHDLYQVQAGGISSPIPAASVFQ